MSSEHKTDSRSGGVEVVADQGDDGSFEIRLERQPDATEDPQPADGRRASTWQAQPSAATAKAHPQRRRIVWVALAGALVVFLILGIALAQSSNWLQQSRPQTVEVNDQPRFRGYVIAGQEPERARNVRVDAPSQPATTYDEADDEDDFYDDELEDDDLNDDQEDSGPSRIELRSTASGGSFRDGDDDDEQLSDREKRIRSKRIRDERAQQELKAFIEDYQRLKQNSGDAEPERPASSDEYDDSDDDFFDEYDEYDEEAFDEHDEYDGYAPRR